MNEAISDQRLEQSQRPVVPCTLQIPFFTEKEKNYGETFEAVVYNFFHKQRRHFLFFIGSFPR